MRKLFWSRAAVAGVLVLDPSAFPKKGTEAVGVQRQASPGGYG